MSTLNGHNGAHTTPIAGLLPNIIGERDKPESNRDEHIIKGGTGRKVSDCINWKQRMHILRELTRLIEERKQKQEGFQYKDVDEWYKTFTKICEDGSLEVLEPRLAYKEFLKADEVECVPKEILDIIKLTEPEPEPKPKPVAEPEEVSEVVMEDVKEQLIDEAVTEKALARHNNSGIALYSSYITPDADKVLDGISLRMAHKVYKYLAGNIEVRSGKTHKRSRTEIMGHFGISERTWRRVEAEFRKHGLIEYHTEDSRRSYDQRVMFILPHVKDWYNNVQIPVERHKRKTQAVKS